MSFRRFSEQYDSCIIYCINIFKEDNIVSLLHIAVILPLIFALIIPILYRFFKKIHLGWFVLPIPVVLFIYFLSLISTTQSGNTVIKH